MWVKDIANTTALTGTTKGTTTRADAAQPRRQGESPPRSFVSQRFMFETILDA
jgi:hypothetical protein